MQNDEELQKVVKDLKKDDDIDLVQQMKDSVDLISIARKRSIKNMGLSAGYAAGIGVTSATLKRAKSISIKIINKKIVYLTKVENKIQELMKKSSKKDKKSNDSGISSKKVQDRNVQYELAMTNAKIESLMEQLSEAKTSSDKYYIKFQLRQLNERKEKLHQELQKLKKGKDDD